MRPSRHIYFSTLWIVATFFFSVGLQAASLEPIFTHGSATQADNTLVNRLRLLLQQAKRGSDIRFSVFLFYYQNPDEPLLLDILAAAERGANVQILIDLPESENAKNRKLGQLFQENFSLRLKQAAEKGKSDSWITGSSAFKNHSKLFLFSDSMDKQHWVIITSENLTDREREKHQAGLIINDAATYRVYEKYWRQIHQQTFEDLWISNENPALISYFFPQRQGDDIIYKMLDQMLTTPEKMRSGKLRLTMARWTQERFPIAMKLVQLAENGMFIEVVTRENPAIVDTQVLAVLNNQPNISLFTNDVSKINIHSKYILFEGYLGDRAEKILWTGSHNFTGMALRYNYETWLEIRNPESYDKFLENFEYLKKISSP